MEESKKSPQNVANAVKIYLRRSGTLRDAAKKLDVAPTTLSTQLAGKDYFSDRIAGRLASKFGFDPDFLTTGVGTLFTHGGKRENAGKPRIPEEERRKNASFRLSPETITACKQLKTEGYQVGRIIDNMIIAFAKSVGVLDTANDNIEYF